MKQPRGAVPFKSVNDVRRLFLFAFEIAVARLGSADLALLHRTIPGRIEDLKWMPPDNFGSVVTHLGRLGRREAKRRFDVDHLIRAQLLEALGGKDAMEDGRRMFVLAAAVDRAFQWPRVPDSQTVDTQGLPSHSVIEPPQAFFAGIPNPPPPLGQMTAVAICHRWMTNFWVAGDLRKVRGIGPPPRVAWLRAAGRLRLRLEDSLSDGKLRIATVGWRVGSDSEIRWHVAPEHCFAVAGFEKRITAATVTSVLDHLRTQEVDVCVLPELGLDEDGLRLFREELAKRRARFPVLVVASMVHRATEPNTFVNQAVLLDGAGNEIFRHAKLEPFTLPTGAVEAILPGPPATYVCFDTPVGRLVINICRDFRSDVPMILNRLLGASLILIPAWSRKLDFVLEEARVLGARQGAIVVSSNLPIASNDDVAASYAPIRGGASGHILTLSQVPSGGQVVVVVREFAFGASHAGVASVPVAVVV